jgi:hypothetical protein
LKRPDLLESADLTEEDQKILTELKKESCREYRADNIE